MPDIFSVGKSDWQGLGRGHLTASSGRAAEKARVVSFRGISSCSFPPLDRSAARCGSMRLRNKLLFNLVHARSFPLTCEPRCRNPIAWKDGFDLLFSIRHLSSHPLSTHMRGNVARHFPGLSFQSSALLDHQVNPIPFQIRCIAFGRPSQ
jgi:hypothetical protein